MSTSNSNSRLFIPACIGLVLSCVALVITVFLSPLDGIPGEGLQRFFGRWHPLVLHFPVVLLPLALGFELLRIFPSKWRSKNSLTWETVGTSLWALAAISACFTAMLGVLLAANEGHTGLLVERHKLLGVSVAVLAVISISLRWAGDALWPNIKYKALAPLTVLSLSCVIMMAAAHDGGSMVHGKSYLSQYAPNFLKGVLSTSLSDESSGPTLAKSPQEVKLLNAYTQEIAPILDRNCSSCHGDSKQKAGIRFDELNPLMVSEHDVERWSSVRDALNSHQMPPPEEGRQPSSYERQQIVDWLGEAFDYAAVQHRANRASPMRRLSVNEYKYTLQELFGTEFEFGQNLPSAPISEHGYSRDNELLSISALELEYFLDIAREAVEHYVVFGERLPENEHFLIEFEDVEYRPGVDGGYSVDKPLSESELSAKLKARAQNPVVYSPRTLFPLPDGPALASTLLQRSVLQKFNGQYAKFQSKQRYKAGELVARVHVAAKLGDDGSAPRLQLRSGLPLNSDFKAPIAGECDVTAPPESPQVCTFRIPLRHLPVDFQSKKNTGLQLFLFNVSHDPDAVFDVVPEGLNFSPERTGLMSRYRRHQAKSILQKNAMRKAGVNELYLDAVEVDILPFGADVEESPKIFRIDALRAGQNSGINSRSVAEMSLQEFMTRAYRRSIAPVELEEMLALYDQFRSEGDNFQKALKEVFSTVLVSAPFLYIAPPVSDEIQQEITQEEHSQIASRLSYFLWNSPPDDRLLDLTAHDKLSDPATLSNEVERMLEDTRSRRFTRNFAWEWLRLDKYDLVAVNPEFYPYYDDDLGKDMIQETITTFQEIFHKDKDARELITSDTVYVNQRLARHYGLPAVTGGALRAVAVPDYRNRGGLLHQGAILTMTADGAESNPTYRGVWVLERLLNDPPPPPPPSVPPLETSSEDFASLTLKEKMQLHSKQSACSACHAKIDPWGLALENFDAIGAWREASLVINPNTAEQSFSPVDSSTKLTTGEEINGSRELLEYLHSEREEEVARALSWHMMTYALGRAPNLGDEPELEKIHSHFRASGYKLSALVLAIVQSDAFQAFPLSTKEPAVLQSGQALSKTTQAQATQIQSTRIQ